MTLEDWCCSGSLPMTMEDECYNDKSSNDPGKLVLLWKPIAVTLESWCCSENLLMLLSMSQKVCKMDVPVHLTTKVLKVCQHLPLEVWQLMSHESQSASQWINLY